MTEKGFRVLQYMIKFHRGLIGIVFIGRDKNLIDDYSDKIESLCREHDIPLKNASEFRELETNFALAFSWRWLLKVPEERLIVFHDSLLPKYRGFAPLVNSLIAGERQIGVTALFGARNYDQGNIICQFGCEITYPITIHDAIALNMNNYFLCIDFVAEKIYEGSHIIGRPQDEKLASFSIWRNENDYSIDWDLPSSDIRRFIDAVGFPYSGASCVVGGRRLRVFSATEVPDVDVVLRHTGKVLFLDEGRAVVICGSGLLRIDSARWEDGTSGEPFYPLKGFRLRFS